MKAIFVFCIFLSFLISSCDYKNASHNNPEFLSLDDSIICYREQINKEIKRQDSLYRIMDSLGYPVNWDSIKNVRIGDSLLRLKR